MYFFLNGVKDLQYTYFDHFHEYNYGFYRFEDYHSKKK